MQSAIPLAEPPEALLQSAIPLPAFPTAQMQSAIPLPSFPTVVLQTAAACTEAPAGKKMRVSTGKRRFVLLAKAGFVGAAMAWLAEQRRWTASDSSQPLAKVSAEF